MLIEFSVTNYLSFCQTQVLNLTSVSAFSEQPQNLLATNVPRLPDLVRSMVIYGANASGKSNLVRAAQFVRNFVLNSAKEQAGDVIPVQPFRLHSRSGSAPSIFEMTYIHQGIRYQYGFAVTREQVQHEWLLAYPKGRPQRWFERYIDPKTGNEEWYLHRRYLPIERNTWKRATRSNALFLSTAVQLNSEVLKPAFDWFADQLFVFPPHAEISVDFTTFMVQDDEGRQRVLEFLNDADLRINDIQVTTRQAADQVARDGDPAYLRTLQKLFKERLDDWEWEITDIQLGRTMADSDQLVLLPWKAESQGTQKMFALAGPWIEMLEQGKVMFLDEMATNLHHNLVRFLFGLLHHEQSNKHGAQLISTTHDTGLLDDDAFRRDQFWMLDRDAHRCTRLSPLKQHNVARSDPIQQHYLAGRYGAVPQLKRLRDR